MFSRIGLSDYFFRAVDIAKRTVTNNPKISTAAFLAFGALAVYAAATLHRTVKLNGLQQKITKLGI